MKENISEKNGKKPKRFFQIFGKVSKFVGIWLGFTSMYSSLSVCPFCGKPGCPVGMTSAGIAGFLLTLFLLDRKAFFRKLIEVVCRSKSCFQAK